MVLPEFEPFSKIPRLSRECTITEKIDGTNGVIYIPDDLSFILAGSRSRWLTPEADNFNFCKWVMGNQAELMKLGAGFHYGEWWGIGIQRGYGLKEKRFSLFNTHRWSDDTVRPACCHVVPVLHEGNFDTRDIESYLYDLKLRGSMAAPGFMDPEGIVVYHTAAKHYFKKTIKGDEKGKGE